MRRSVLLIALALAACQPQASAHVSPSSSPAAPPGDLIYVHDPNAPRMLEMDWSGKVRGSVSGRGFMWPSADGSRFVNTDLMSVEDQDGRSLGRLTPDVYSLSWADDNQHVCAIVVHPGSSPDTGRPSLWIGAPGETGQT